MFRWFKRKRQDPLISALIGKLPQHGAVWGAEERNTWMLLMRGALDLLYRERHVELVDGKSYRQAAE